MLTVPKYNYSLLFFSHPVVRYQREQRLVGRSGRLELVVLRLLHSATDLLLGKPAHGFGCPSCKGVTNCSDLPAEALQELSMKLSLAAKLCKVFRDKVALPCPGEGSRGGMTWKHFLTRYCETKRCQWWGGFGMAVSYTKSFQTGCLRANVSLPMTDVHGLLEGLLPCWAG